MVCPQHIPGFRGAFALLTVVATFDQVLVYVPLLKREGVTCADLEAERFSEGVVVTMNQHSQQYGYGSIPIDTLL